MRIFLIPIFYGLIGCGNKSEQKEKQENLGIPVSTTVTITLNENGDTLEKKISTLYMPISSFEESSGEAQIETLDPAEQQKIYDEWFQGMSWYTPMN